MKVVRYATPAGVQVGYLEGDLEGDLIVPVAAGDGRAGQEAVLDLAMAAVRNPDRRPPPTGEPVPLAGAALLAPVAEPASVRDFYAFEQHVRTARARRGLEMQPDWYELPVFYFSSPAAIVGPGDGVAAPPRSAELDYEVEVACVLGADGREVRIDDADRLVAGFMVMNDWSARDVQRREMQLSLGPVKGKDFATSLGPCLVTRDEFAPLGLREVPAAAMVARVNGVEYSRSDLSTLWWSFAEMVAYAAEAAGVRRGDVLGSGTCGSGCILELALVHGADRYPYLTPGDEVEVEVEGLGVLANRVVAGDAPAFQPDPYRARPRLTTGGEPA
ncbi:MAG TPA: fumarylacetoacetate hydrolase family protein [Actinomycetes bacterium]|jgi:fumarylacetoacetate (FAA) hydrolase|nr:fumarylacetoacetate hydrolase family protein [Actinomycetes bacterium]